MLRTKLVYFKYVHKSIFHYTRRIALFNNCKRGRREQIHKFPFKSPLFNFHEDKKSIKKALIQFERHAWVLTVDGVHHLRNSYSHFGPSSRIYFTISIKRK